MAASAIGSVPAAAPTRPRTLLIGTSFATAATAIYFLTLFGVYAQGRSTALSLGQEWISPGTIPLAPGTMMMATMVLSLITVQWAVYSIARDDRQHAILALVITAIFGGAVINQTAFLYTDMGLPIATNKASLLLYVITGSHLVMIVVGLVFLALMAFRALAGQYSSRQADGVSAAAIFWYAVVAVYAVIWYAIYITK